jgi:c(7)-type cytochrome triheme protein
MRRLVLFLIALTILGIVASAYAWNRAMPAEFGRAIIGNYTKGAGLAPVVFDHWLHRSLFTCRLCHADIGFAMKTGGTNITAATNMQGYHCGACHDGKRIVNGKVLFASCAADIPKEGGARCDRCHSQGKKVTKEYDFTTFTAKLPKTPLGNGVDWEEAEAKGLIKPVDFLEGVSMKRDPLKTQNDFSIQMKANWIGEVIFSHKKHAAWNGCEVCHPEIFPSVRKGTTNYTMFEIIEGRYCGVCHDKVAFPFQDCSRCHTKPVQFRTGSSR